ncbi:DMT family transporter [Bacillus sp. DJP31]|uniref:DMT family transporter n=1 Tax=Bacillus sp. DJP31 TaxID=3409789 RepID=UPI003BB78F05
MISLEKRSSLTASLYAFLSITFWGVSFVSTKDLLESLDIYTIISMRFGIAAIFLFLLLLLLNKSIKIQIRHFHYILILAVIGVFVHQLVQASALLYIDASAAGWIISFSPVFTVILSVLFLSERFSFAKLIGLTIAITGVVLVTTHDTRAFQILPNIGYILMIFSTLNWAVYSILIKKFSLPYSSLAITFWTSLTGFILTIPFSIRSKGWIALTSLPTHDWIHLIFLGVFVSAIAYWYWGKALEVLEANQVSVFMYLEPLVTLIAAMILLKEHVVLTSILGGICIILGVSVFNNQVIRWAKHFFFRR